MYSDQKSVSYVLIVAVIFEEQTVIGLSWSLISTTSTNFNSVLSLIYIVKNKTKLFLHFSILLFVLLEIFDLFGLFTKKRFVCKFNILKKLFDKN